MNMRLATRTVVCCAIAAAGVSATGAHAQTANQTGALSNFVNDARTSATDLQRQAGYAVQGMCGSLATEGGVRLTGPKQDLFLRCNEMVETARVFQSVPAGTGRTLGYSDRGELLAAIQQVSGEELAAQGTLSTQVSAGQFSNIGGRLTALRMGSNSQRLGGGASADEPSAGAGENRVGWFVESSYGFGDHDQTSSEDAFDYDSMSVTTGTDYNFGSSVVGISFGYDRYQADFDTALFVSGGDVQVDGISGSLFAGYFAAGWNLSGIATYGSLESDVTRRVFYNSANAACNPSCGAQRTMSGSPDGSYVALGLTAGYEINVGGWDITPSLSASYRDVDLDGYSEADGSGGGLALRYDDQKIESTRSIVGIAVSRPISRSFGVLVPSLRAEWHHEFEDDVRAVRAKYVLEDSIANGSSSQDFACAISCFTMLTDQSDADYAIASVGVSATFPRRVQVYVFYEALLGTANVSGNSIAAGLRGQF